MSKWILRSKFVYFNLDPYIYIYVCILCTYDTYDMASD